MIDTETLELDHRLDREQQLLAQINRLTEERDRIRRQRDKYKTALERINTRQKGRNHA